MNKLVHYTGRAGATARRWAGKTAAVVGGTLAAGSAFAATSIGQTAATAIDGAKSEVNLVQAAMIGVLVLLVVFLFIRRSFGK